MKLPKNSQNFRRKTLDHSEMAETIEKVVVEVVVMEEIAEEDKEVSKEEELLELHNKRNISPQQPPKRSRKSSLVD